MLIENYPVGWGVEADSPERVRVLRARPGPPGAPDQLEAVDVELGLV